ncbi:RDD family protein [Leucothrix pacifica]|uniref:TIR domain-containing protein n=1 Tax=Leucothrix pacifica TaxID=1247513 RepID=A0A317CPC3_9GAMM|nr:RDD family protein [Leucothrix pacifica]PWR00367.1 hypothetical protein DKW60_02090 [Leucothrix pacifica]
MLQRRQYAGFWLRIFSFAVDYVLIQIVFVCLSLLITPETVKLGEPWELTLLNIGLQLIAASMVIMPFWLFMAASPGKRLFGLSIIDLETGEAPSKSQYLIRFFSSIVSVAALMLGVIWIAFDIKKQGWHDKLAKTSVISSGPRRKIFINYRQKVSLMQAGRVSDAIAANFGYNAIFHDKSSLVGGSNWKQGIEESLKSCAVMLVVIGDGWLDQRNPDGTRRLDDPDDYVAMEIATALKNDFKVVPVLVDNAPRLHSDDLPDRIKDLAFIEPIIIRDDDWNADIRKVIEAIYLYTEDPRKIGWRNFTSLFFSFCGMMMVSEDVVATQDAIAGGLLGIIGAVFGLASFARFRVVSSHARSWSIGLIIFAALVVITAISDS